MTSVAWYLILCMDMCTVAPPSPPDSGYPDKETCLLAKDEIKSQVGMSSPLIFCVPVYR